MRNNNFVFDMGFKPASKIEASGGWQRRVWKNVSNADTRLAASTPGGVLDNKYLHYSKKISHFLWKKDNEPKPLLYDTASGTWNPGSYKNMTYAPVYYGIHDRKKLNQIVTENLTKAGLYEEVKDVLHKSALKLSGGQQQRLCIARALTAFPEVLMLDEPCSALDINSTRVIEELLLQLKESYTLLLVTHNLAQAKRIADYVCFMKDGKLIEMGKKEDFFSHPEQEESWNFVNGEL